MTKQSPRFCHALDNGLLIKAEINNCPGVRGTLSLDYRAIAGA